MTRRPLLLWQLTGLLGLAVLPWYAIEDGFWNFEWLFDGYPFDSDYAPLLFLFLQGEAPWLWPTAAFLAASTYALRRDKIDPAYAVTLLLAGGGGFAYVLLQGFTIGIDGWEYQVLNELFGPMERQYGMGYGALLIMGGLFFLFTQGLAARGAVNGDVFVVSSIGLIVAVVAIFIFFPVFHILISAVQDNDGAYSLTEFTGKLFSAKIWGLHCLTSTRGCGVAWNSFVLAVAVGVGSTLLGLAFALIATRTGFRYKRALRALTEAHGILDVHLFDESGDLRKHVLCFHNGIIFLFPHKVRHKLTQGTTQLLRRVNVGGTHPLVVLESLIHPPGVEPLVFATAEILQQHLDVPLIHKLDAVLLPVPDRIRLHASRELLEPLRIRGTGQQFLEVMTGDTRKGILGKRGIFTGQRTVIKLLCRPVPIPDAQLPLLDQQLLVSLRLAASQQTDQRGDLCSGPDTIEVVGFARFQSSDKSPQRAGHCLVCVRSSPHACRHFTATNGVFQLSRIGLQSLFGIPLQCVSEHRQVCPGSIQLAGLAICEDIAAIGIAGRQRHESPSNVFTRELEAGVGLLE